MHSRPHQLYTTQQTTRNKQRHAHLHWRGTLGTEIQKKEEHVVRSVYSFQTATCVRRYCQHKRCLFLQIKLALSKLTFCTLIPCYIHTIGSLDLNYTTLQLSYYSFSHPIYSAIPFIQPSHLFSHLIYSTISFIQLSHLFSRPIYSAIFYCMICGKTTLELTSCRFI